MVNGNLAEVPRSVEVSRGWAAQIPERCAHFATIWSEAPNLSPAQPIVIGWAKAWD
jgi:hypothetical protein